MDPFEIPQDVTAIDDLAAAEEAAQEAVEAILAQDDPSDQDLERAEAIADHIDRLREEGTRRDQAAQARRDRAESIRTRTTAQPEEPEAEGGDGDPVEGDDPEVEEPPVDVVDPEVEGQPSAVAAAAGKRPAAGRRRMAKQPANPRPKGAGDHGFTITAGAGIPNVEAGSALADMKAVVAAFQERARSHPEGFVAGLRSKHHVATFTRDFGDLSYRNPAYQGEEGMLALMDAAADETRLVNRKTGKGGSLAAAGGWCAPSQTLYDLVELEEVGGFIDVPEIGVSRGGINFTTGPDFTALFAGIGFALTEAQVIAGTDKTCYEVPCPTFSEVRLDAVGICIKSPILTAHAYPELVRRVLNGAMIAHEKKKSVRTINSMVTALGTATAVFASGSIARSTLTGLELAAEGIRNMHQIAPDTTLEVVLPHWLKVALRADLQDRNGQVEPVSDAQLAEHFVVRHLRVQYVYGFGSTRIDDPPGTPVCLADFPDTAPAMIYPAGTFVRGMENVLRLDTMYDSTDLTENIYTAAFVEEGMLVAKRQNAGCNLTLTVSVTGQTGPQTLAAYGITDV